ncbi:hypothetical protein ACEPAI_2824 [Sanghuangporus weigelae]
MGALIGCGAFGGTTTTASAVVGSLVIASACGAGNTSLASVAGVSKFLAAVALGEGGKGFVALNTEALTKHEDGSFEYALGALALLVMNPKGNRAVLELISNVGPSFGERHIRCEICVLD